LVGLVFGQKHFQDRDFNFYGVSGFRRKDPET